MAILNVNDGDFEEKILKSEKPVIVDYWAEWCGPCKMIAPILEEADAELSDKVTIAKLNIDENPHSPSARGVKSIPTLMLFKNGEVVASRTGALSKSQLMDWINENC
jgi:thioredoxin 1